jgi:hypothetical protein
MSLLEPGFGYPRQGCRDRHSTLGTGRAVHRGPVPGGAQSLRVDSRTTSDSGG